MDNSIKITLIIIGAVILLALIGVGIFYNMSASTVSAFGKSEIKATPDKVVVYFNVQTKGENASEAKDKNAEIVDNVLTSIIKLGFERKDIATENFNVYPDYSYYSSSSSVKGYTATHSIKVEMSADKFDEIGNVIDAGVDNGALISYINFELSLEKQNEYKAEALKQAGEDARNKAEATAAGLGKKVGNLVSVLTSDFNYYPWQIYRNDIMAVGASEAKMATTSIQPGQETVSAQITAVFKIR
jgi:uncharacterized protein YggE